MADLQDAPVTSAQFYVRTEGTVPVIEIAGEIDLSNVEALNRCLAVFDSHDDVVLDLSRLTYIDSRGIAAVAQTRGRGVRITCRGADGLVRRVFTLSGMSDVLAMENATAT
jgi:anti-anti-sigma factor